MSVVAYRDVSQSMGQKRREKYRVPFCRGVTTRIFKPYCLPIRHSRYILPGDRRTESVGERNRARGQSLATGKPVFPVTHHAEDILPGSSGCPGREPQRFLVHQCARRARRPNQYLDGCRQGRAPVEPRYESNHRSPRWLCVFWAHDGLCLYVAARPGYDIDDLHPWSLAPLLLRQVSYKPMFRGVGMNETRQA